jgi:hypothetical protein
MTLNQKREAWNKGKLVGQKPPLKLKDIWAIRLHLQNTHAVRYLAMFNLAIDSKLRGCDHVSLRVRDITHGNQFFLGPWSSDIFASLVGGMASLARSGQVACICEKDGVAAGI